MSSQYVYIDGKDRGCIGNTFDLFQFYQFVSKDDVAQKIPALTQLAADGCSCDTRVLLRDLVALRETRRAALREEIPARAVIGQLIRAIRQAKPAKDSMLELFDEDAAFEAYPEEGEWGEQEDDYEDDERNRDVFTMFSFGYWGWGNATEKLVEMIDAVEKARGFKPPVFVDVRLRRSGRAEGFVGDAFAQVVGAKRYIWEPKLGNQRIASKSGPRIKIAIPSAANELLELAQVKANQNRRVIFFCACNYPKWAGATKCHRATIAKLLTRRASAMGRALRVEEWPGGDRRELELRVPPDMLRKARQGSIPLGDTPDLAKIGRVRIGSLVTVLSGAGTLFRVADRPVWRGGQWVLPVPHWFEQPKDGSIGKYERIARRYQKSTDLSQAVD